MWTFGRKIAFGFALAFLLLLVIGGVAYTSIDTMTRTSQAVAHSQDILHGVNDVMSTVAENEGMQRGFLLTGDEAYLPQLRDTEQAIPKFADRLRSLIGTEGMQAQRLASVLQQVETRVAFSRKTVDLRRQSVEAAMKVVLTGEGKVLTDELRRRAAQLEEEERRVLKLRAEEAESAASNGTRTIIWGTLLCLAVIVGAGWLLTSSLTQQIAGTVQHVQRSSNELQSAATQQAAGARESSTAMNEITTTISELLATSRQIAESAQRVAGVAEQTADAARLGDGTVMQAKDSITGIRQQVDMVVDHMLDLGRKSQQIGAVLDIVSELAEQTNILAINATIEATGAGEMGKRFGVVADEIRKLADRVAGSTKEIRGLIDDVRSAVNTTVMATETGSKAVDMGARQFSEVATAFGRIAALVATTTEAAREIELSTKQQTTAVEQVNIAIANTAQATRETEASSGQTFQTAAQLNGLSKELLRMVQPQAAAA